GASSAPVQITLVNPDNGTWMTTGVLSIDDFRVAGISPNPTTNGSNSAVQLTVGGSQIPTGGTTHLELRRASQDGFDSSVNPIEVSGTSLSGSSWQGSATFPTAAAGSYTVQLINVTNGVTHTGTCGCVL